MNVLLRAVPFAALTLLAACETVQTTEAGAVGVHAKAAGDAACQLKGDRSSRLPRSTRS